MMAANYMPSEGNKKFLRICMLVFDVIPDLLQDLGNTLLPASRLSAELTKKKHQICRIPSLMKDEKAFLYPPGRGVYQGSMKGFDMSLLYILLRNLGNIPPHQNDWGNKPDIADRSLSANIDRLREQRNNVAHAVHAFLSDGDFQASCDIIRQSVEDIQNTIKPTTGFVAKVDNILNWEMDHRMTNTYIEELLVKIQAEISTLTEDVSVLRETLDVMATDSRQVRDDVSEVKEDVKTLKDDSSTVKEDVGAIKEDVGAVKEDVGAVKEDVGAVKEDISSIKDILNNLSTGTNHIKEVDSGPPMTNVAGACARTHQMAVTGTTLGRDPETYLCDSVGWQFYLDYLASKLSAEISVMSVYLDLESAKLDEIKNRCKSNRHEMCFNVLWTWYGKNPDKKTRIKQMSTALKESGRADLAQQLMEGNVPVPEDYRYQGEIKNPDEGVSSSDALKVGKHLTLTFQRLARYFGLDENNIQRICIDNNDDIQEQSYNTIMECIKQLKLKNRQQLCNGLAYLKQVTTVSELNQMW